MNALRRSFIALTPLLFGLAGLACNVKIQTSGFFSTQSSGNGSSDPQSGAAEGGAVASGGSSGGQISKADKDAIMRRADVLYKELNKLVADDTTIPAAKLSEFKSALDDVNGVDPKSSRFYAHQHKAFVLENGWRMPEAEGNKLIADKLGAAVASAGVVNAKKMNLEFSAKAGHCYTVFMRFLTSTNSEKIEEPTWSATGGNTPLQRYYVPSVSKSHGEHIYGTCVTKDVPVKMSSDLVFAGTKNGVRYLVLDSPKPQFPLYLATYMWTRLGDSCDTEAWYNMWADPIPGSIAYAGNEPFMIGYPDRAGQLWLTATSATMRTTVRLRKPELTQAPPKSVKFATQYNFPGCPEKSPEHPDSIKLAKCHEAIDKKYQAQWDAAVSAKEHAPTAGAYRAAQATIDRIKELDSADRRRLCTPIENQISKKWEETFNKIVDLYTDQPYKSPIDRAGELAAQDYGW